jgi:2-dehydropantoate 2-reductase
MKISIIGTGGVGGYFGGRLALAGNDVTFIARGEHLEAIQKKGLVVKSIKGDFIINPAKATDDINCVRESELIIVCTKAWQVKEIAKKIAPLINEETIILPTQNGVMAYEELIEFIPKRNVIGGLCRTFCKIESPGVISHMGLDPTIVFGEIDNIYTERISGLNNLFNEAGITNIVAKDIEAELWKKFIMICSSALLAVTNTNYGELRSNPETRALVNELYKEIFDVAIAAGIKLSPELIERTMQNLDTYPPDSTSSLTRDVREGRPSEIEYQNGTVVKLGIKHGVPTPVNRFVYYCIKPSEEKARKLKSI